MSIFGQILEAVNSPNQQGSIGQLAGIMGAVQQLSQNQGMDANTMQGLMSVVGGAVRSSLQQKRTTEGVAGVESLLNQFAGTSPNPNAVQALFSPQQQQQVAQMIHQKTGMDVSQALPLLAMAVPVVLNMLKTGSSNPNVGGAAAGGNPVLNSFLDADGDGDADIADAISMAGRFLAKP